MSNETHFHVVVADENKYITGLATYGVDEVDTSIFKFLKLSQELCNAQVGDQTQSFSELKKISQTQQNFFISATGLAFIVAWLDCGILKSPTCPLRICLN